MTFYYQCECGERINKLTGEFANSKEEILDKALYDIGKNLTQCPKCGTKYKMKKPPFILETDLLYSSIVGCPNPPISGGPCTQVMSILPSSRGLKKHNEDYPIMQDLVL